MKETMALNCAASSVDGAGDSAAERPGQDHCMGGLGGRKGKRREKGGKEKNFCREFQGVKAAMGDGGLQHCEWALMVSCWSRWYGRSALVRDVRKDGDWPTGHRWRAQRAKERQRQA